MLLGPNRKLKTSTDHPHKQNIYYSQLHMEYFSRINQIAGHETSLKKFNRIETKLNIFLGHNSINSEINNEKNFWKTHKDMEVK